MQACALPTTVEDQGIAQLMRRVIVEPRVATCATAGYAARDAGNWRLVGGGAGCRLDTPFDLASVSKPLTALAFASLVEKGNLDLDTPLEQLLEETAGTHAGGKTMQQLLSHRAGLSAHVPLFIASQAGQPVVVRSLLRRIASCRGTQPNDTALYSDLGYILAGAALGRFKNSALDRVIFDEVTAPWHLAIGSSRMHLRSDPRFLKRVAPTEITQARGGLLRGVVHDENAWALSGFGASGHAGMFGALEALLTLGVRLLDNYEHRRVAPLLVPRPGGTLLMGFDGKSPEKSSAGSLASSRTFGHLGFTGTSLWCDPEQQRVVVLLTNRVHPTRDNPRLSALRSVIHDFLWKC